MIHIADTITGIAITTTVAGLVGGISGYSRMDNEIVHLKSDISKIEKSIDGISEVNKEVIEALTRLEVQGLYMKEGLDRLSTNTNKQ